MSIFGKIWNAISGHHDEAAAAPPPQAQQPQPGQAQPAQAAQPTPQPQATAEPIDVEAELSQKAEQKGGGGNWRTSIVDLLKLLDLDSGLEARKELANEMNVHIGADGSAEENIALHKAVMRQLADNGAKVPADMQG